MTRYDIDVNNPWSDVMYPAEEGQWVGWEDVEPLLKELQSLRRHLEVINEALNSGNGSYRP